MTILTKKYSCSTPAAALFFKNKDSSGTTHQAMRVEIPELGKEFTCNAYIGKDPEGIFHYNAASDIRDSDEVKAKVCKVTVDNKDYAHIKFFTSKESETYAEFVAEDDGAVDATGMVKFTENGKAGKWSDLDIGSANANVYKRSSESKITLTAGSISKEATLILADSVAKNFAVDVQGILYFKKLSNVKNSKAKYASYNDDRIVFYEKKNTGEDFVAYFIPFEGSDKLGITSAKTVIISDTTWASTPTPE